MNHRLIFLWFKRKICCYYYWWRTILSPFRYLMHHLFLQRLICELFWWFKNRTIFFQCIGCLERFLITDSFLFLILLKILLKNSWFIFWMGSIFLRFWFLIVIFILGSIFINLEFDESIPIQCFLVQLASILLQRTSSPVLISQFQNLKFKEVKLQDLYFLALLLLLSIHLASLPAPCSIIINTLPLTILCSNLEVPFKS